MWRQMKWWEGPVRGWVQLVLAVLGSGYFFFLYDGRWGRRHPTMFEEFQSGSPSEFTILFGLAMLIYIGYSITWFVADRDGR